MSVSERTVFFIEWDAKFARILKGVTLSQSLRGIVAVHIFYSPNKQENGLPPYKPWILKHPVLTTSKEGLWKMVESYTLRFNFGTSYALTQDKRSRTHGNGCSTTSGQCSYYILSSSQERSQALARKVDVERGVRLGVMTDAKRTNLLDFLKFKCDICKIAFKENGELQHHNQAVHGLTCLNITCRYSKKENAFDSETGLRQHIKSQLRCEFCPTKVFCASLVLDDHMKSTHRQCGCGCRKFFGSRTAYLDHFFSTYPSPKDIASISRLSKPEEVALRKSSEMSIRQSEIKIETFSNFAEFPPLQKKSFSDENEDSIDENMASEEEETLELNYSNGESENSDIL